MKAKIKVWLTAWLLFTVMSVSGVVYAAANGSLLQTSAAGEDVTAYIISESGVDSAEVQIAQYLCEDAQVVMPEDISVHTVIMVDNSLSVTKSNRENIKTILRRYVQGIAEQEVVSLAVFGEEIEFFALKSKDQDEILQRIDALEFHNQDTYLTDFLYEELEAVREDSDFTRFVIISDGVDNKDIGITKEELFDKLEEISRPVYAVGHIYKNNETELKNMFALSRVTGGQALMMEDYDDTNVIADAIHDFSHLYAVKAKIPKEVMDGGNKNILLRIHTPEGDIEVTGETRMPFGTVSEDAVETNQAVDEVPVPLPQPEITPQEKEEEITPQPEKEVQPKEHESVQDKKQVIGLDKIVGIIVLAAAVLVLIIYQKKHKTNQKHADKKKEDKKGKKNNIVIPVHAVEAEPVSIQQENETVFLDGRYLLVLRDRMSPDRIFKYPLDGHVTVGRNVDMVQIAIDYNRTISKRHCEFYVRNNHFFIRDMNSANHTYVDGKMINSEREIVSGSIVRLGEAEFSVEIMPI